MSLTRAKVLPTYKVTANYVIFDEGDEKDYQKATGTENCKSF
jgi:hypothetical protein